MQKTSFIWMLILFLTFSLLGLTCITADPASAQDDSPLVIVLTADGPISPAMIGAPDASAIPSESGTAMRKTTSEAGRSRRRLMIIGWKNEAGWM